MRRLRASLEQASLRTEWDGWMKRVLTAAGQVDFSRPGSWNPLVPLSENTPAMRWLVRQIRLCNPVPPEQPHGEAAFLMLAAFCPDNRILGYLIDTWRHYCRTGNGRGLLSCARVQSLANRQEEYPHLNVLYNLMMGDVLRQYRLYAAPADRGSATSLLTERDFRALAKYLPDFHPFGLRERVQAAQNRMTGTLTGGELARACCMSDSAFRRQFRQEFGIPVSEWLRRQRMARIERMLRSPDIPLCQVAEENGFRMPSTFADYCRRNFGAPPGQLRRQLAEPGNGLCSEISGL